MGDWEEGHNQVCEKKLREKIEEIEQRCPFLTDGVILYQKETQGMLSSLSTILEKYERTNVEGKLSSVLGKGSYGKVFYMKEKSNQKQVALKIIEKSCISNPGLFKSLNHEIDVHRSLLHDNIIRLYEHCEDERNIYLVMEYAAKGSLFRHIRQFRRLSEKEAFYYFTQACNAVHFLHKSQLIHRDIKPENMLITGSGQLKLCDFGSCISVSSKARRDFCGTLEYMAPEIIRQNEYKYKADVWSLGALLYEMLHGHSPFRSIKEKEVVKQILECKLVFAEDVKEDAKELLRKILEVDQDKRLSIVELFDTKWIRRMQKEFNIEDRVVRIKEEMKANEDIKELAPNPNTNEESITVKNSYSSSKEFNKDGITHEEEKFSMEKYLRPASNIESIPSIIKDSESGCKSYENNEVKGSLILENISIEHIDKVSEIKAIKEDTKYFTVTDKLQSDNTLNDNEIPIQIKNNALFVEDGNTSECNITQSKEDDNKEDLIKIEEPSKDLETDFDILEATPHANSPEKLLISNKEGLIASKALPNDELSDDSEISEESEDVHRLPHNELTINVKTIKMELEEISFEDEEIPKQYLKDSKLPFNRNIGYPLKRILSPFDKYKANQKEAGCNSALLKKKTTAPLLKSSIDIKDKVNNDMVEDLKKETELPLKDDLVDSKSLMANNILSGAKDKKYLDTLSLNKKETVDEVKDVINEHLRHKEPKELHETFRLSDDTQNFILPIKVDMKHSLRAISVIKAKEPNRIINLNIEQPIKVNKSVIVKHCISDNGKLEADCLLDQENVLQIKDEAINKPHDFNKQFTSKKNSNNKLPAQTIIVNGNTSNKLLPTDKEYKSKVLNSQAKEEKVVEGNSGLAKELMAEGSLGVEFNLRAHNSNKTRKEPAESNFNYPQELNHSKRNSQQSAVIMKNPKADNKISINKHNNNISPKIKKESLVLDNSPNNEDELSINNPNSFARKDSAQISYTTLIKKKAFFAKPLTEDKKSPELQSEDSYNNSVVQSNSISSDTLNLNECMESSIEGFASVYNEKAALSKENYFVNRPLPSNKWIIKNESIEQERSKNKSNIIGKFTSSSNPNFSFNHSETGSQSPKQVNKNSFLDELLKDFEDSSNTPVTEKRKSGVQTTIIRKHKTNLDKNIQNFRENKTDVSKSIASLKPNQLKEKEVSKGHTKIRRIQAQGAADKTVTQKANDKSFWERIFFSNGL